MSDRPYNPLEKIHLAESVASALLRQPCMPLPPPGRFSGAGLYALYYRGACAYYRRLTEWNQEGCEVPIYVGKAVPEGARRGLVEEDDEGTNLRDRLREHGNSIRRVEPGQPGSIHINEFACRYIVTDELFIRMAETLLIRRFRPVWNTYLDGFGDHAPGSGRRDMQRPLWDMVHPGRAWAKRLRENDRQLDAILGGLAEAISRIDPPQPPGRGASPLEGLVSPWPSRDDAEPR